MTLADFAARLIRSFEGCMLTAYKDGGGVWTIGFGHTLGVVAGMTITFDQASLFLSTDMAPLFKMVTGMPLLEAAAYIDFGFDCGMGALADVLAGRSMLLHFVHDAKGVIEPGLLSRRLLEDGLIQVSKGA